MATQYDPTIIATFADYLYAQAHRIVISYTLLFLLVSVVLGGALGGALGGHADGPTFALVGAVLVGAAGSWVGYSLGRERAFALKLQAQTALCQMQIEENTRRARVDAQAQAAA